MRAASCSTPDGPSCIIRRGGPARRHQPARRDPLDAIERFAHLEPMPPPDPARSAPRDVIVAVKSAAVGWVDLIMTSGQYQHLPEPPYSPGPRVRGRRRVGRRRVAASRSATASRRRFLAGPRSIGAYQAYGGFASYAVAPADAVHAIPGELSFDQACNLLGNYETAYHCLVTRGRLRAGETVLVHGASGSTGLAAVQVAKLARRDGHRDRPLRREARDVVKAQGADHTSTAATARPLARRGEGAHRRARRRRRLRRRRRRALAREPALRGVRRALPVVGWAATPFVAKAKASAARRTRTAADEPDHDEGARRPRLPDGDLDHQRSVAPRRRASRRSSRGPRPAQLRPHVSHVFPLADFETRCARSGTAR